MVEARFGGRPPTVLIMGVLDQTNLISPMWTGQVPPWVVTAGGNHVPTPGNLGLPGTMPAVRWTFSCTWEAPFPRSSDGSLLWWMFARGPFLPEIRINRNIPYKIGQSVFHFDGDLAVPPGYNRFEWRHFSSGGGTYSDGGWTMIG